MSPISLISTSEPPEEESLAFLRVSPTIMILAFSALLYTKQKSHSLEQMHMYKERDSLFELPLPYPFFDGVDEYISIC